jgi:hypothetical protein
MRYKLAAVVAAQGSGSLRSASSRRPRRPNRSATGQESPWAIRVAWMRAFSAAR